MSEPSNQTVADTACYVYGIVPAKTWLPADLSGLGDPAASLTLTVHRDIAAVISDVDPEKPVGTRRDLLAHERVLDALASVGPVLPMRFGAVITDREAVTTELLAAHHDEFAEALEQFAGHVQFNVSGTYDQDVVLREVLAEVPRAAQLRERLEGLSEDASYFDRIRLGAVVSETLASKREQDQDMVVNALEPAVVSMAVHQPAGDQDAFEVAFLVNEANREQFEEIVEELGRTWSGRVRMSLLGPLPPYDFVSPSTG